MVFSFIKSIKISLFWSLFKLFLKHPLWVIPTLKATKKCIRICNVVFGKLHHKNNPTNAFRHALWNFIIAKECLKWYGTMEKVIAWAKTITDWHEAFSPNPPLAREMDLHNNRIGRDLFVKHINSTLEEVILILKEMTSKALKISVLKELESNKNHLVYI